LPPGESKVESRKSRSQLSNVKRSSRRKAASGVSCKTSAQTLSSFPRRRESTPAHLGDQDWIPAFAGMTSGTHFTTNRATKMTEQSRNVLENKRQGQKVEEPRSQAVALFATHLGSNAVVTPEAQHSLPSPFSRRRESTPAHLGNQDWIPAFAAMTRGTHFTTNRATKTTEQSRNVYENKGVG